MYCACMNNILVRSVLTGVARGKEERSEVIKSNMTQSKSFH